MKDNGSLDVYYQLQLFFLDKIISYSRYFVGNLNILAIQWSSVDYLYTI